MCRLSVETTHPLSAVSLMLEPSRVFEGCLWLSASLTKIEHPAESGSEDGPLSVWAVPRRISSISFVIVATRSSKMQAGFKRLDAAVAALTKASQES
jgi:hypothetical protein